MFDQERFKDCRVDSPTCPTPSLEGSISTMLAKYSDINEDESRLLDRLEKLVVKIAGLYPQPERFIDEEPVCLVQTIEVLNTFNARNNTRLELALNVLEEII